MEVAKVKFSLQQNEGRKSAYLSYTDDVCAKVFLIQLGRFPSPADMVSSLFILFYFSFSVCATSPLVYVLL